MARTSSAVAWWASAWSGLRWLSGGNSARVLGLLLAAVFTVLAVRQVDLGQVGLLSQPPNLLWLAVALGLALANIPLKAWRWRLLMGTAAAPAFGQVVRALILGQFANIGLPLRIGDVARVVALSRESGDNALTLSATVVVERWLDVAILCASLIGLLPLLVLPTWFGWLRGPGVFIVGLGAVGFLALLIGRRAITRLAARVTTRVPARLAAVITQFAAGFDVLSDARAAGLVWGLTVVSWAISVAINAVVALALGLVLPVTAPTFVLLVLSLGATLPSAPLRIGNVEYLCILALGLFGVAPTPALSYGLLLHGIGFAWPVILGPALLTWPSVARLFTWRAKPREAP